MANLTKKFIKPEIIFPLFPTIYVYIYAKYDKVQTPSQLVSFVHHCFDEAEVSENPIRKAAYQTTAKALYGVLTGESFESKRIELQINN